eukprot:Nitzschia sp. Nitz4//scaffold190_size42200//9286//10336//NITZ4_007388-RA/size42200-snap-gene-0.86-mRNA-1//-1//CDS//3329540132//8379//frame0
METPSGGPKKKRFGLFRRRKADNVEPPLEVKTPSSRGKEPYVHVPYKPPAVSFQEQPKINVYTPPVAEPQIIIHHKVPVEPVEMKKSFLCRTKFFQDMIQSSFDMVDQDGSGTVDEKELYSGLLLIHLKLGIYAGPAACKPISREKCHAVFTKMDADRSGSLDRDEFEAVMMVLFGNVMMRVLIQYACSLLIVPLVAKGILDGIYWCIERVYVIITTLDEHYKLANIIEVALEKMWDRAITFWASKMPSFLLVLGAKLLGMANDALEAVPDSVWDGIPLTLLSTVLSLMLIPWSLLKIDDFFQKLADSGNQQNKLKHP